MGLVGRDYRVAGAQHHVRAALVDQRLHVVARRDGLLAPLVDQPRVVAVHRRISPLVGAGQRGHAGGFNKGFAALPTVGVQSGPQRVQLQRQRVPVVQQRLEMACDLGHGQAADEIGADQHQLAVAAAVTPGCKTQRELACSGRRIR